MKVAALDLGSNTFLLLIAEVENGKIVRVYHDECQVTRLAQGVDASREFHSEALARAKKCLDDYGKTIRQHRPARLLAVATSAARDAKNKDEFFNIAHEAGIPVKVISGVLEARLTFRGAVDDLVADRRCRVVDIGGGSTEYIVGGGEHQPIGQSLDMGCVRLTEKFISTHPVPEEELGNMRAAILGQLDGLSEGIKKGSGPLVAVAGTPTTLAAVVLGVEFDAEKIHGYELSQTVIEEWLMKLAAMTVEDRAKLPGMVPLRADVIVAGLVLLSESLRFFAEDSLIVSTRGVRFGVAQELANENSDLSCP